MFNVPLPLSYFRTVQPELKSLAVGFHSLIIRALGMLNIQIKNLRYTFSYQSSQLDTINFQSQEIFKGVI